MRSPRLSLRKRMMYERREVTVIGWMRDALGEGNG
jgi:hypothetical protein